MAKINNLSQYLLSRKEKNKSILVAYLPALYPNYETSKKWINRLLNNGVDALELGYPAKNANMDGKIIKEANKEIYANGFDNNKYYKLVADINLDYEFNRLILMGYWNELKNDFFNKYKKKCLELELDSLILPDLNNEEDKLCLKDVGFNIIPFIDNLNKIKYNIPGDEPFVYCPSYLGKTGQKNNFDVEHLKTLKKELNASSFASKPHLVGFGISSSKDVKNVMKLKYDGIIVGSALLEKLKISEREALKFLNELKKEL